MYMYIVCPWIQAPYKIMSSYIERIYLWIAYLLKTGRYYVVWKKIPEIDQLRLNYILLLKKNKTGTKQRWIFLEFIGRETVLWVRFMF